MKIYKKNFFIPVFILFINLNLFSYDSENIQLLESGNINYALASWWLPDNEKHKKNHDDTPALQAALSSGAEFVTISDIGRSWITDPLFLESNQTVFFDKGVIIESKKGSFRGKGDTLFTANNKKNISLYGNGAVLRMRRADYTFPPYKEGQWRHCLSFKSCRNMVVKGLTLMDSGGDGIYLGVSEKSDIEFCENIQIENICVSGCYRQGISVISVENLEIRNSVFKNTGNHSPSAGIDFEPNSSNQRISRCVLESCVFRNNFGPGILFFLASLDSSSYPVSVKIKNCKSYTNRRPISIRNISDNKRGEIILENNVFIGFKGIDPSTGSFKIISR